MTTKTACIYIANDGTEFTNKEACLAYEKEFLLPEEAFLTDKNNIVFLDKNGCLIDDIKLNYDKCQCQFIEKAFIIIVKNRKAISILDKVKREFGYCGMPWRIGLFYYDESDGWQLVPDDVVKYIKVMSD